MKDKSIGQVGGTCSILVGVSYIVIGISLFLVPAAQRAAGVTTKDLMTSIAQNPTMLLVNYWAFALGALVALGAVPAISSLMRSSNEGWVQWATTLGVVGFAVTALNTFRLASFYPGFAISYVGADAARQAALESVRATLSLDPQKWPSLGAVGAWVLIVSVLALRSGALSCPLALLGIVVGIAYWLAVLGYTFRVEVLFAVGAGLLSFVLGRIWYVWVGLKLRGAKVSPHESQALSESPA